MPNFGHESSTLNDNLSLKIKIENLFRRKLIRDSQFGRRVLIGGTNM